MHCPFFWKLPVFFDRLGFALLQTFYRNTRASSLSYQQVTKLPHLAVSFWGRLAIVAINSARDSSSYDIVSFTFSEVLP